MMLMMMMPTSGDDKGDPGGDDGVDGDDDANDGDDTADDDRDDNVFAVALAVVAGDGGSEDCGSCDSGGGHW